MSDVVRNSTLLMVGAGGIGMFFRAFSFLFLFYVLRDCVRVYILVIVF